VSRGYLSTGNFKGVFILYSMGVEKESILLWLILAILGAIDKVLIFAIIGL